MSRSLVLFGLGLLFGGTAGFLIAASSGTTLDGHDHSQNLADEHAGMKHGKGGHGKHDELLSLVATANAPTLAIEVLPDSMSGWNLQIKTENFRFSPENASKNHISGEGHAHIYINGAKTARHYGNWFHIPSLKSGKNEIEVTLNANDHRALAIGDKPLRASMIIEVK